VPGGATNPRVGLVTVTLGDDGAALEGAAQRYDGLVVAGFGVGHVPEPMVVPLAELAGRIPVVLASRTGAGPVLAGMYAFPGSEYDLLERGLLRAGFLDPLKARLLLWTLLRATTDREVVAAAFAVAGGYADPASWPWSAGQDSAR
jgi:L-asparaginase